MGDTFAIALEHFIRLNYSRNVDIYIVYNCKIYLILLGMHMHSLDMLHIRHYKSYLE